MSDLHNYVCRYCTKMWCGDGYVNRCYGCGSVCCIACDRINNDNINRSVYYKYKSTMHIIDSNKLICMESCLGILYCNEDIRIVDVVPTFNSEDNWIHKPIKKYLLKHLIKNIADHVIEYI